MTVEQFHRAPFDLSGAPRASALDLRFNASLATLNLVRAPDM